MSDKPISVGDLVMVVKDHPCSPRVGHIHRVVAIDREHGPKCPQCGWESTTERVFADLDAKPRWGANNVVSLPLSWLKKIPPLEKPEREQRHEELMGTIKDILGVPSR